MVTLNHAIAAAMVQGPAKGIELLRALDSDPRIGMSCTFSTRFVPICWKRRARVRLRMATYTRIPSAKNATATRVQAAINP